jgi:hypothetical protein
VEANELSRVVGCNAAGILHSFIRLTENSQAQSTRRAITHTAIAQKDLLLIAAMNANVPTTKHQTCIGSHMVEFFSTIPDKNLSRMCVLVQIGQNPPSLQCEYDQHISAFSPTTVKASNMFHPQVL